MNFTKKPYILHSVFALVLILAKLTSLAIEANFHSFDFLFGRNSKRGNKRLN